MDENALLEKMLEMQELLLDVTAHVMTIRQALYRAHIVDPQAMDDLFRQIRQKVDASPEGKGLREARIWLEHLKGIE